MDKDKNPVFILNELRMTGRWTRKPVPEKEHRFFQLRSSGPLKAVWYSDYRGFGTFQYIDQELEMGEILSKRGPDILSDTSEKVFVDKMKSKPRWQIVKAMLAQDLISGIGNWIKSDALYLAKIDPRKRINQLTDSDLKKVYRAVMKVIHTSLENKGSVGYTDFDGNKGGYEFLIYDKKEVKEGKVKTIKLTDGRTTHFVPDMFKK